MNGQKQWRRIQNLPPSFEEDLKRMYSETIPIEIRGYLAEWIEEKPWSQINENDELCAIQLLEEFLQLININGRLIPLFEEFALQLENKYVGDPLSLIRDMKACLNYEQKLLERLECAQQEESGNAAELDIVQFNKEFEKVIQLGMISCTLLKTLEQKQQEFYQIRSEVLKAEARLETDIKERMEGRCLSDKDVVEELALLESKKQQLEECKKQIPNFIKDIWNYITALKDTLHAMYKEIKCIMTKVFEEDLLNWKHKQQLACNGEPLDPAHIQNIQKRCGRLQELITRCLQNTTKFAELHTQILTFIKPYNGIQDFTEFLKELNTEYCRLLVELVSRTFIVERQPPQILNTGIKFDCSISLLVGKVVSTSRPKVTAYLIDENAARKKHEGSTVTENNAIGRLEIYKDVKLAVAMEELSNGSLSANLTNLTATRFKDRRSRKTEQKIAETKYCIVFETQIKIGDNCLIPIQVLSIPVIVVSHVNYHCDALATIMWDHQFSAKERKPFDTPEEVMWPEMANLLDKKFKSETGRGLTDENLTYIASKLFGQKESYSDDKVSKEMFCKENLKGQTFTFWDWIYHVIRLTKEHLLGPWKDGHIIGFIHKAKADRLILNCGSRHFLFRFSDSVKGGVSVVYKRKSSVKHFQPLTSKDFQIESFSQIVIDSRTLKYLYPHISKKDVFQKYIDVSKEKSDVSDYTKFIWTIQQIVEKDDDDDNEMIEDDDHEDLINVIPQLIEDMSDDQFAELSSNDPEQMIFETTYDRNSLQ